LPREIAQRFPGLSPENASHFTGRSKASGAGLPFLHGRRLKRTDSLQPQMSKLALEAPDLSCLSKNDSFRCTDSSVSDPKNNPTRCVNPEAMAETCGNSCGAPRASPCHHSTPHCVG